MTSKVTTMGEIQEDLSACPTFSSYSSDRLVDIAARVTDEFKRQSDLTQENLSVLREDDDDDDGGSGEDDFEFSLVRDTDDDPVVFYEGQTPPILPIFNRHLLGNDVDTDAKQSSSDAAGTEIRIPLRTLFIQDREECEPPSSSSSSSEADEMERIPPGTYCVWRPKKVESWPGWCKKKSNSTGSWSKRWKLLDLLRRSNSDGKDSYVFLTPRHNGETTKIDKTQHPKAKQTSASAQVAQAEKKSKAKGVAASPSAHEAFYVRNRAIKRGEKKKSYLPYRQDLVGFFANVNALGRTFSPF